MLTWLALTLSATAAPGARRLGLVGDSARLWARAQRLRHDWREHEQNCHQVVDNIIATLQQKRVVVVLGSGLQRDISLASLSANFETVVLVDAVHLWPARRHAARFKNVRCLTHDVSEKLAEFAGLNITAPPLETLLAGQPIDLIISANILSQLAVAPEEWLEKKHLEPQQINKIARSLVEEHLALLARLPGRVCLLTDIEMRETSQDGTIFERHDLLAGYILPAPDHAWDWPVAPLGLAHRTRAYIHRVHAYRDFKMGLA